MFLFVQPRENCLNRAIVRIATLQPEYDEVVTSRVTSSEYVKQTGAEATLLAVIVANKGTYSGIVVIATLQTGECSARIPPRLEHGSEELLRWRDLLFVVRRPCCNFYCNIHCGRWSRNGCHWSWCRRNRCHVVVDIVIAAKQWCCSCTANG